MSESLVDSFTQWARCVEPKLRNALTASFGSQLGKDVGDDLREGKPTLPLLVAMERGSPAERDLIRRVEGLGLPVTAVVPAGARMSAEDQLLLAGAAGANVGDIGLGGSRRPDGRP